MPQSMKDKLTEAPKPNYSETSFSYGDAHFKVTNWYTMLPPASEASVQLNGEEIATSQKVVSKPTEPVFDIPVQIEDTRANLQVFFYGFGMTPKVRALLDGEVVYGPEKFSLMTRLYSRFLGNEVSTGEEGEQNVLQETVDPNHSDADLNFEDKPGLQEYLFTHEGVSFRFSAWWAISEFKNVGAYKMEANGVPLAYRAKNANELPSVPVLCFENNLLGKMERYKVYFKGYTSNRRFSCSIGDSEPLTFEDNSSFILLDNDLPRMNIYEYYLRAFVALFPFVGFAITDLMMDGVPMFFQISLIAFALFGLPILILVSHGKATGHLRFTKVGLWFNLENLTRAMKNKPIRWYFFTLIAASFEVSLEHLDKFL